MMLQYKYVTMETGGSFWFNNHEGNHREIIDQHAAEGWRFAGTVPLGFTGHGGISSLDLVFEKNSDD